MFSIDVYIWTKWNPVFGVILFDQRPFLSVPLLLTSFGTVAKQLLMLICCVKKQFHQVVKNLEAVRTHVARCAHALQVAL